MKDPVAEEAKELHRELDVLLAKDLDDRELRDALDRLSEQRAFQFVYYRLIRPLLERDPVLFAPLVRPRLDSWAYDRKGKLHNPWVTPEGKRDVDWLLRFGEERDDQAIFKAAMRLRLDAVKWTERDAHWCEELRDRFERVETPHQRASVLARMSGLGRLDDDMACYLYEEAPVAVRGFILQHLPFRAWKEHDDDLLGRLLEITRRDDKKFHFELYRELAGSKRWRTDVTKLLEKTSDEDLVERLERRHLRRTLPKVAEVFTEVLEARGDVGLPYVMRHVDQVVRGVFGTGGYSPLMRLARKRGYDALWAALLRYAAPPGDYNSEVRKLLDEGGADAERRLLLLAGMGRELSLPGLGLTRVQPLEDATALELYRHDPELLRGPFKRQLFIGWHATYPKLTKAVLDAEDEDLTDYLASRMVTRAGGSADRDVVRTAERLSQHYEALRDDPKRFAERAANVLGQVPPFVVWNYDLLLASNRLARLLYEHSAADYLASPNAIRDLLEAPEIHAQRLAYRALSLRKKRARKIAAENLDLLAATLLRPLHRRTRLLAFEALLNAGRDESSAAHLLAAAREALYLPDLRYPKEELVGLIGQLLYRHPSLRGPREQPRVYRSAAC